MQSLSRVLILVAVLLVAGCGQSTDGSKDPGSASKSQATEDKTTGGAAKAKPFEVTETAYTTSGDPTSTVYVHWIAVIKNPNADAYGIFPVLRVTARDVAGKVLATDDQTLGELPPGMTIAFSSQLDTKEKPAKVEVIYSKVEWHDTKTKVSDYKEFAAKGVAFRKNVYGGLKITGEITNPFPAAIDGMAVTALLRDAAGKLIGGSTTFTEVLPSSGTQPFELDADQPKTAVKNVSIMAMPWGTADPIAWNHLAQGQPLDR